MVACSRASNGGFDLAAKWMGWENIFHCEWNPFGQKILKYYWPNAISYDDITKTDFTIHRGRIDILTGGFPCQPYSVAGKRKGKEDERHLWPEMLRAIREIQPGWVVGENVGGLINWNGGMVFDEVQADLEAEGYEVWAYVLPACAVNAPHRRDRVWFIAFNAKFAANGRYNTGTGKGAGMEVVQDQLDKAGRNESSNNFESPSSDVTDPASLRCNRNDGERTEGIEFGKRGPALNQPDGNGGEGNVANTTDIGLQQSGNTRERRTGFENDNSNGIDANSGSTGREKLNTPDLAARSGYGSGIRFKDIPDWQNFPQTKPTIHNGDDGISSNSHRRTFQNENSMDRSLVIKKALDQGRLMANHETGKIYSIRQRGKEGERIELTGSDCNGYRVHNIHLDGVKKQVKAHQIVWISANGLYNKETLMIDHIDRDKTNNRLSNLRLVDAKGNRENQTPYEGKLTQEQKDMIYFLNKESQMSMREIAEDFGISKSRVHQLIQEHQGLDGITFSKWSGESIKGGGNAIVPQVAFEIFKTIEQYEKNLG